ncbi:protein of unknown function (plasmid) [Caballeronia sp. S22]
MSKYMPLPGKFKNEPLRANRC